MAEKIQQPVSPEVAESNAEALERAGLEQSREIERQLEQAAEKSSAESGQEALKEALEQAEPKEKEPASTNERAPEQSNRRTNKPTKKELDANFKRSISSIQKDMTPASRTFSKVIHNPAVEKVSEAVGGTIARPNLIIAGGLGTLILCSVVYLIAKRYGYVLSGFEAIGTFILGWCIGAVIEFARVGFINQNKR